MSADNVLGKGLATTSVKFSIVQNDHIRVFDRGLDELERKTGSYNAAPDDQAGDTEYNGRSSCVN